MRVSPPLSPSAALRMGTILSVLAASAVRSVVEVGPGMGAMGWRIARGREYHGFEPDLESYRVAEARLREIPGATLYNMALPEEPLVTVDALVACEVLEHIDDDIAALRSWARWVRPGGIVLLSVPAHQHRFGPWDEAVGHYRRYGRADLAQRLRDAGLRDVEIHAYGMPIGYVLEWVRQRLLARRLGEVNGHDEGTSRSGRSFQPAGGLGWLIPVVMTPFRLLQKPFAGTDLGTGWIAWATRPS